MDEHKTDCAVDRAADAAAEMAEARASVDDPCVSCGQNHAASLLREVQLRHDAETASLGYLAARDQALELVDKANADLLVAIVERDMRVKDEALRAQRVDVEALRAKILAMKKNLVSVDSRVDERFADKTKEIADGAVKQIAAVEAECEARIAAVHAEVGPAIEDLAKVRAGEQARVEALNAALELIWAKDRRDKGAPRNDRELVVELTRVLSAARLHAQ